MSGRIFFMFLGSALAAGTWNYNQCDKVNGPYAWPAPCNPNQVQGTPIDLCNGKVFPNTYTPKLVITNYGATRTMDILNNGYTLQVNIQAADAAVPTVDVGELSAVVGRGGAGTTPVWKLSQMHLHWGRLNKVDEGSEHYIQGKNYVAEAHFVHYNPDLKTAAGVAVKDLSEALATGAQNAVLVVGVMLQLDAAQDVQTMVKIADEAATATTTATAMKTTVTLNDLFDGTGSYYSYGGGLTTPNCNEQVTWVVMKAAKFITSTTLNKIKNGASTNPPLATAGQAALISLYGNFRPLTDVGTRTVYSSDVATAACTAVTQPNFGCSAAFMVSPSVATPLAAIISILLLSLWN